MISVNGYVRLALTTDPRVLSKGMHHRRDTNCCVVLLQLIAGDVVEHIRIAPRPSWLARSVYLEGKIPEVIAISIVQREVALVLEED